MDFIDNFYYSENDYYEDVDSQKINRCAISAVLPIIMKNDLTERQKAVWN